MIRVKVTPGFVTQQFDEAGNCIRQDFVESEETQWENGFGDPIDTPEDDPSFVIELVPPPPVPQIALATPDNDPCRQEPLVASAMSFSQGEQVIVTPTDDPSDLVQHEFMGTVIGIKNARYVMVQDQDGDVFDCEPIQVHHLN